MPEEQGGKPEKNPSILETVGFSKQTEALRTLNAQGIIFEFLEALKPRERQVLISRHGLEDGIPQTLEHIGTRLTLTRERVRQIEKEALARLHRLPLPGPLAEAVELIFQIIEEQGDIARETKILETLLQNSNTKIAKKSVSFILNLVPRFNLFRETEIYHRAWYVTGFEKELLDQVIATAQALFQETRQPVATGDLVGRIRERQQTPEIRNLPDQALESYVSISKKIDKNAYGGWGLAEWPEVHPKDVGDKVYLVLLHHAKPEHYSKITELINKKGFDEKVAHKETVHNELIKDERFVLIGRGIYALRQWGYKKGIVAEIISDILQKAGKPLSREEIIGEVLKQRLVKKNTIIVGLSNRKLFQRTADNKYTNVQ